MFFLIFYVGFKFTGFREFWGIFICLSTFVWPSIYRYAYTPIYLVREIPHLWSKWQTTVDTNKKMLFIFFLMALLMAAGMSKSHLWGGWGGTISVRNFWAPPSFYTLRGGVWRDGYPICWFSGDFFLPHFLKSWSVVQGAGVKNKIDLYVKVYRESAFSTTSYAISAFFDVWVDRSCPPPRMSWAGWFLKNGWCAWEGPPSLVNAANETRGATSLILPPAKEGLVRRVVGCVAHAGCRAAAS